MVNGNPTNGEDLNIRVNPPFNGLEEILKAQKRTKGETIFTVVTDTLGFEYMVCGSVKPEDVAEIVITRKDFSNVFTGSNATELRIEALEFAKEKEDTPYTAPSVNFKNKPGERLLLARTEDVVLPSRIKPEISGNDCRLTYLKDIIQEFSERKEKARFRMDLVGEEQKRVFVYDPAGKYELRICQADKRKDFILVNNEDPTEVYVTRGVGFSKISQPTSKIEKTNPQTQQTVELQELALVEFNAAYGKGISTAIPGPKGK